jgi:hypothetical protein
MPGHVINLCLTFQETAKVICSACTIYIPINSPLRTQFFHTLTNTYCFDNSPSYAHKVIYWGYLEYLVMCLLIIHIYLLQWNIFPYFLLFSDAVLNMLGKHSVIELHLSPLMLIFGGVVSLFTCRYSLCITSIRRWSVNVFLHSVTYLFTTLIVPFEALKSLTCSTAYHFLKITNVFAVQSKEIFPGPRLQRFIPVHENFIVLTLTFRSLIHSLWANFCLRGEV